MDKFLMLSGACLLLGLIMVMVCDIRISPRWNYSTSELVNQFLYGALAWPFYITATLLAFLVTLTLGVIASIKLTYDIMRNPTQFILDSMGVNRDSMIDYYIIENSDKIASKGR